MIKLTTQQHVEEKIQQIENRISEPFPVTDTKNGGHYWSIGGKTAFTEAQNALAVIGEYTDEVEDPEDQTEKINIPTSVLYELEDYISQSDNERLILKGLLTELKGLLTYLFNENEVLTKAMEMNKRKVIE